MSDCTDKAASPPDLIAYTAQAPIVLSDDDLGILALFKVMLERAGLSVLGVPDSRDVLTICRHAPVSLVITDVIKPHSLDGFELMQRLRQDPQTAHLPVMVVTSGASAAQRQQAEKLGALDYLTKPVTPKLLVRAVSEVLTLHGNWQAPADPRPELWALLANTEIEKAPGDWHGQVFTVRPRSSVRRLQ